MMIVPIIIPSNVNHAPSQMSGEEWRTSQTTLQYKYYLNLHNSIHIYCRKIIEAFIQFSLFEISREPNMEIYFFFDSPLYDLTKKNYLILFNFQIFLFIQKLQRCGVVICKGLVQFSCILGGAAPNGTTQFSFYHPIIF